LTDNAKLRADNKKLKEENKELKDKVTSYEWKEFPDMMGK
jgi:cell division protein FtsB